MKINLKKKVMLAVLAGGILCANGALAAHAPVWYGNGNNATTWKGTKYQDYTGACTTGANLVLDGTGICYEFHNSNTYEIPFADVSKFFAGYSETGNVTNNTITINSGTFNGCFITAGEGATSVSNNKVVIKNGIFSGGLISAGFGGVGCTCSNNIMEISGGTFVGDIQICSATGEVTKNNEITISGGNFDDADGYYLVTGETFSITDNKLNLKTKMGGQAAMVAMFNEINFTLPVDVLDNDKPMLKTSMLEVDAANNGGTATINVDALNGVKLNKDDEITLIHADAAMHTFKVGTISLGGADVAKIVFKVNGAEQTDDTITLTGESLDIILVMLQDFEQLEPEPLQSNEDQQKAPVEGIAATVAMINQSADLASGEGMASLQKETVDGFTNTFGAITATRSKYKTGSHVDMDGWGFLVGAGNTRNWNNGEKTTYGLFFEYGKGEFDTYNNDIHGEGDSNNKGVGIIARHTLNNNTYFYANVRYGKQETEWSESEIGSYDTDSKYYGFSVGLGHIFEVGSNELDIYGRYTYGHTGSCDAKVGENEYEFDAVKSSRIRFGAKYNFVQQNKQIKPYIGLAWEREMKGESKATITGMGEAPAPSLKGNTGIMQAGCSWEAGKWTLGAEANAYIGKRKGWGGMFNAFYNF